MTSMITATAWVPRGHAAAFPTKYVFDEDEYARISKLAKLELDDAREDLEKARQALKRVSVKITNGEDGEDSQEDAKEGEPSEHEEEDNDEDDDLKEYDMEHYDDEPDVPGEDDDEPTGGVFGNIKSLAYHADNDEDPYLTLPENGEMSDEDEREELQILPTDSILLAARIEDEVAHLEVYVYEDEADNLYVHHDVMLPAMPLCVEWLGTRPGKADGTPIGEGGGNFAAVGTMDPDIELWDLDVVDGMYPNAILGAGGIEASTETSSLLPAKKKKKKSSKSPQPNPSFHVDSILALSSNPSHRNLLASASADRTIKLWDLTTCTAAQSYSHHSDKVCALAWHASQTSVLLSGGYDRKIFASDMRAATSASTSGFPCWGVESDVEQVAWDPRSEHTFYASTEGGVLHCFDARALPRGGPETSSAVWRLQAHDQSLSAFAIGVVPGMLATGSTDRTVKVWDLGAESKGAQGPSLVVSRDLGVGKVFSANFAPDEGLGFRLAVAGSKGAVQVWDTSTNRAVREAFAGRSGVTLPERREGGGERLVGIARDDEVEEEEAEAEENGGGDGGWESMDED